MSELQLAVNRARNGKYLPYTASLEQLERRICALENELRRLQMVGAIPEKVKQISRPTIAQIKTLVCQTFGLTEEELTGPLHIRELTRARHVAFYLCMKFTVFSSVSISRHFGGRDHSTVLNGRHRVLAKCASDPNFDAIVKKLETALTHT